MGHILKIIELLIFTGIDNFTVDNNCFLISIGLENNSEIETDSILPRIFLLFLSFFKN